MEISKRVSILLLISILLWSFVLRYPDINGPHDSDSFYIQWLTLRIESFGYNPWILNPLSYLGMYPLSYPFGSQTYIATLKMIIGCEMESTIYIVAQFHCILGLSSIFVFSKYISKSNITAVISTLVFSLSYYFISYTFWTISTRGSLISIIPLVFYFFFGSLKSKSSKRYYLMLIFLYLLALTLHRSSAYLIVVIIIPFILIKVWKFVLNISIINKINFPRIMKYITLPIIIFPLVVSLHFPNVYENNGIPINHTWINEKFTISIIAPILNLGYKIITNNILIFFSLIGFLFICFKQNKNQVDLSLLILLFISSPFIVDYEYFFPIILPIFSTLGGIGLVCIINKVNSQKVISTLIIILITSCSYTLYIQELNTTGDKPNDNLRNVQGIGLTQETRNNALWIGEHIPSNVMNIDGFYHTTHSSLIDMHTLRQMDLVTTSKTYKNNIVIEQLSISEVLFNQKQQYYGGEISSLSGEKDIYEDSILFAICYKTSTSDFTVGYKQLLKAFEVKYIIEPAQGEIWWLNIKSLSIHKGDTPPFYHEVYNYHYKIYNNELRNIYFFNDEQ